jgi:hypothetical protein
MILGHTLCIAVAAFVLNAAVSIVLTLIFGAGRLPVGADETLPAHCVADPEATTEERIPALAGGGSPEPER